MLSRQNAIQIMAALQTFLSRWLQLKSDADKLQAKLPGGAGVQRKSLPINELARRLAPDGRSAWMIQQNLERIKNLTAEQLAAKKVQLCALERMVKFGEMPDYQALTIFIAA